MHAEAGGHEVAESHEPHLQQAYSHDLDHGGEHVDVAVFEPASGSFEIDVFVPYSAVAEFSRLTALAYCSPILVSKISLSQYFRWRPPLRAPPVPT